MKILFELSKEHSTLPLSEIKSCLNAEGIGFNELNRGDGFLEVEVKADIDKIKRVGERIALSFFIDEALYSSPPNLEELLSRAVKVEINGTFRVRCWDRRTNKDATTSLDVERGLGGIYTRSGKVDLFNPDTEIRVMLTDDIWYVGKLIKKIDRGSFENRKVQKRPFFSPISLHPRLARTMVNLSLIKRNEFLLDPFCGTGGILLEAGLIGAKVIGSDLQQLMVDGCRRTLDAYGIKDYNLFSCDIGEIPSKVGKVDAVVTDFPYGRAATTNRESIKSLYQRGFESISTVLKDKKRAVATLPTENAVELGKDILNLIEVHPYRVHRSLTRYIAVYER